MRLMADTATPKRVRQKKNSTGRTSLRAGREKIKDEVVLSVPQIPTKGPIAGRSVGWSGLPVLVGVICENGHGVVKA